jgi:hypothetical protein
MEPTDQKQHSEQPPQGSVAQGNMEPEQEGTPLAAGENNKQESNKSSKKPRRSKLEQLLHALNELENLQKEIVTLRAKVDEEQTGKLQKLITILGRACFKVLADQGEPEIAKNLYHTILHYVDACDFRWISANGAALLKLELPEKRAIRGTPGKKAANAANSGGSASGNNPPHSKLR